MLTLCLTFGSQKKHISLGRQASYIVKLSRKEDLSNCNNWRRRSVARKVLAGVILSSLATTVHIHLRKEQAGFRKSRSCADQIFKVPQILAESRVRMDSNSICPLYRRAKAFDTVNRPTLWRILVQFGIIKMLYSDFMISLQESSVETTVLGKLRYGRDVKQCRLLSPLVFPCCIDWLMKETTKNAKKDIT